MLKLIKFLIAVAVFLNLSIPSLAEAASFSVTTHAVTTTPTIWNAATIVAHNTKDGSSYLGAGLCTTPRYDLNISAYPILSFGSVCQFVSGSINNNGNSSNTTPTPITTTGGTVMGYDMARWDAGGDTTGQKPGVFVGFTLSVPTTLGQ